jgi:hypothetical protein
MFGHKRKNVPLESIAILSNLNSNNFAYISNIFKVALFLLDLLR